MKSLIFNLTVCRGVFMEYQQAMAKR